MTKKKRFKWPKKTPEVVVPKPAPKPQLNKNGFPVQGQREPKLKRYPGEVRG